ncbi:hypothetical protein AQUCO_03200100v1 [Aquilegia coerulea]|uniref:Extracellular ligand-gated ion channel protein n=1 Tax=Aquilegia coerulea TaxID=218851 RepID=A0A2G5D074_AQUCA|nr:hypothetical protein AQUCO_03200100v1 [Aquilegia coerulea]
MGDDEKHVLLNKKKDFSRCVSNAGDELQSFRSCLRWMCVDQSNPWRASLSWFLFFLLAIIAPALSHFWYGTGVECDEKFHRPYDGVSQLSLTSVATVSFLSLSKFVRKYGLRRFLYLDKLCDESENVRQGYTTQLHRSMKLLALFVLPCFGIEVAYKIWWYSSGASQIPFWGNVYVSDTLACILELSSWLYRTSIFFLVCVLFRLICYLQILRLQDFAQVFQEESDVVSILKEHLRIRRHLRVISHRYRAFILSALMIITASQFASLLNTTRSHADVSIYRAGELALCSMTMMAGLYILLRSATKITHKAQSITCLAAKWHICATLDSFDATNDSETPMTQIASSGQLFSFSDEEDVGDEECDINTTKILTPTFSHTICFQKRQALVTYLENNQAGITVFGFMLDRTYLHTIFGIEMSLVLWLLGKTIGIS